MSEKDFNIFCNEIGFKKNPKCDIKENGGKYKIVSLNEYIKRNGGNKVFNIKKVDDKEYLLLYRFDSGDLYGKNLISYFYDYETTIKKYMDKEIHLFYVLSPNMVTKNIEQWGHRPGFGINVSYYPINFYAREFYGEPYILSEFWIPMSDNIEDISVCIIPEKCTWTQISCDKKTTSNYDLIAHTDNRYEEFNITDLGRKKVKKVVQYLDKNVHTLSFELTIYPGYSLLDLNVETKVFKNKKYKLKGGGKNYYEKYLKYKTKYLDLCCKKNY